MRKKMPAIVFCMIAVCMIAVYTICQNDSVLQTNGKKAKIEDGRISKIQVAQMLSALQYTTQEAAKLQVDVTYEDVREDTWYFPYIKAVLSMGLGCLAQDDTNFGVYDYLTSEELDDLLKQVSIYIVKKELASEESEKIYKACLAKLPDGLLEEKNEQIEAEQWLTVYMHINKKWFKKVVKRQKAYIFDAKEEDMTGELYSSVGMKKLYGYPTKQFAEKSMVLYSTEKETIYLRLANDEKIKLKNAYIVEGKNKKVSIFLHGNSYTFSSKNKLEKDIKNVVGDVTLQNGKVNEVHIKGQTRKEKIVKVTEKEVVLANSGAFLWESQAQIYQVAGEIATKSYEEIPRDQVSTSFVFENGKICAALIEEEIKVSDIRVLINNTDFTSVYHEAVTFKANSPMTITYGETTRKIKKGKKVTLRMDSEEFSQGKVVLDTKKANGKITFSSIKRNGTSPKYRGKMYLYLNEKGITVVNHVSLEEYLYAVIPSEMPTSYPKEALKVQAVCARSYAYTHLNGDVYKDFDADVDDSTACQVYNNLPENEESRAAVDATCGEVLLYNEKVVSTFYYSTSAGHSTTGDDIWDTGSKRPYLNGRFLSYIGKKLPDAVNRLDLTKESDFKTFIKEDLFQSYDSENPWYRWKISMKKEDLKNMLDCYLATIYENHVGKILTKGEGGKYIDIPVGTIGDIKSVEVVKREKGGIATQVVITGSTATIKVESEYVIRSVLAPRNSSIKRQDKSVVNSMTMLPSAFFYTEEKGEKIVFFGGGFGHGVGMSQTGVAKMTEDGKKYAEILQYFYNGCEISAIYR